VSEVEGGRRRTTFAYLSVALSSAAEDEARQAILRFIADNGGEVTDDPAPGILDATFSRVSGAVTTGVGIVDLDRQARVGIHAGEPSQGLGSPSAIAQAARAVRAAAPAGSVFVTETVRAISANVLSFGFVPVRRRAGVGAHQLQVYSVVAGPAAEAGGRRRLAPMAALAGVAVAVAVVALFAWWAAGRQPAVGGATASPPGSSSRPASPAVSPTLEVAALTGRIAIAGQPRDGSTSQLFVADANGTHVSQITSDESANFGLPSWSADGARLVFAREPTDDLISRIWKADADGANAAELFHAFGQTPRWSPDGQMIAFRRETEVHEQAGIDIYDIAATSFSGVIAANAMPAWFPDNATLVAQDGGPGVNIDLFRFALDGSQRSQLTDTPTVQEYQARVNPAGTLIAFAQGGIRAAADLATMTIDGMKSTKLTSGPADDLLPVWSPDGEWILFASDRGDDHKYDIYVISATGGEPRLVLAMDDFDLYAGDWTGR